MLPQPRNHPVVTLLRKLFAPAKKSFCKDQIAIIAVVPPHPSNPASEPSHRHPQPHGRHHPGQDFRDGAGAERSHDTAAGGEDAFRSDPGSSRSGADPARRLRAYGAGVRHRIHQCRRPDLDRAQRSEGDGRHGAGLPRAQFLRSEHRLSSILQKRTDRHTDRRHRPGHRFLQHRRDGPAGSDQPERQETAEHEHRARRNRQGFRRCVRTRQPAYMDAARRGSRPGAEGVHRRRGPALLPAPRHR